MADLETDARPRIVAVLGNPNAGKSTLFNGLTGIRQQVGNYPGVTVERRSGRLSVAGQKLELVDLPGTYSLAPHSPEELLTVQVLLGLPPARQAPDLILCVVDASNLQRNLFLVSQVLELQRPTVVAVNMIDVAARHGLQVDCQRLSEHLGVPVIPVQAKRRQGFEALKQALAESLDHPPSVSHDPFPPELRARIDRVAAACPAELPRKRFTATRLLFDPDGYLVTPLKSQLGPEVQTLIAQEQQALAADQHAAYQSESHARYAWIDRQLEECLQQVQPRRERTVTDQIDAWLTHPVWGLAVAVVVMVVLFQLIFWIAEPASAWIDALNGLLAAGVSAVVPEGTLHSLLVDGLINGVGGVLVFLPQILLLFLILGILEDSGYLARSAFLLDRYLSRLGLSGVSLFPLLSSFACAIPGVMATRVIQNPRERLVTILIAPLMSCSARLPVYVLLIATFVPQRSFLGGLVGLQGLTMMAMYSVGVVAAIGVAWVLRKTLIRTSASSFLLELPSYKVPSLRTIGQRMWEGGWSFVRDAGTMIVVVTILVWAAAYFPQVDWQQPPSEIARDVALVQQVERQAEAAPEPAEQAQVTVSRQRIAAYQLRHSYLGMAGQGLEPVFRPLGWDWRIGSAALASFPAREVVVSTMGVIFGLGADMDESSVSLRERLRGATWEGTDRPLFTLPVALSIMVFFALCAQCVSTLAVIRRETGSFRWPLFTFAYMTVLAYVAACLTYQLGRLFWGG